jgi:hypothetical protein
VTQTTGPAGRRAVRRAAALGVMPALFAGLFACGEAGSDDSALLSAPCFGGCDEPGIPRPTPLPRPRCPEERPRVGDPCTLGAQLPCGWGDEDDASCRSVLECAAGTWTVPFPYTGVACVPTLAADCPEQVPQQETQCLISLGVPVRCAYAGALTCYCGGSGPSAPGTVSRWACYGAPADRRCPERAPNLGEGCAQAGVACDYSPFRAGCSPPSASRRCSDGAWGFGAAPGVCDL